jgi:hypothetical protein
MCALLHGLRLFAADSAHSIKGRGTPSIRPKEAVRRARRARFAVESLETRDLMSGMTSAMPSSAASLNTVSAVSSMNSAPASTTASVVPQTAQFTLSGEAVSSTAVNLYWSFAADNSYLVCEQVGDGVLQLGFANESPTPTDSYSVTGLSPNTSYSFYVVDTTYKVFSSTATQTTWVAAPSFTLSAVPSGQATTSQVNVSWSSVPGATGYSIQYQANGSGPWTTAGSTGASATSYSVTGLSPNTFYDFQMSASNSLGTTTSASQTVTTLGAGPPFTLTAASPTQVNVSWSDVAAGADYVIDQEGANGTWTYAASSISGTSASITGLSPYTPCTFKVGVVGSWGVSWANPQTVTTLPEPLLLGESLVYPAQVNLSWNSAPGATSYIVYEQDASTGSAWQVVSNTTGTSFETPSLAADSYYNFKVSDLGAWGLTTSNVETMLTLATAPTLSANPAGPTQVNLSWNSVFPGSTYGGITEYQVAEQVSGGGWVEFSTYGTSFTVASLNPNTTYSFQVGATNGSGTSWSSVVTALTYPAAPQLQATLETTTQVTLSWNSVRGGAAGFLVVEDESGVPILIGELGSSATSFTVSGLSPGTSYQFQVAAYNATGYVYSNTVSTLTLPVAPTINALPVSSSQVDLSWNSVAGASGYLINEWANGSLQQIINVGAPSSGYDVTGLFPNFTYTFQVESYNASGYSWSNSVSALTLPAAPTFTLTAVSQTQINVSWTNVEGASDYWIYDWIPSTVTEQLAMLPNGSTSYSLTGLTPGTTYAFMIGASNASGTTWASVQSVATLPSEPTVTLGNVSTTAVNVSWNGVAGATSYAIDEFIAGTWEEIGTAGSGTTSFTVSGLTPGGTYQFMVGAVDSSGTTWSTAQSITLHTSRIGTPVPV